MIQVIRARLRYALLICIFVTPAGADPDADVDRLIELLLFEDTVDIMRLEGLRYGKEVGRSLLPDADDDAWPVIVSDIYDSEKMLSVIRAEFRAELDVTKIAPMITYFESTSAQGIVVLENEARRAFLDPGIEAEAIEAFGALPQDNARLADQIAKIIDDSDLVEFNVMGTLNSSLMFYRGLREGGAYDLSEDEIFADVWSTEDATRQSSADWLGAFMTLAYQEVDPDHIDAYAAFYNTPEGRELNRAIFAAFDRMYEEISYLMGLSVARHMATVPL